MKEISISDILTETLNRFKKNWLTLLASTAISFIVPIVIVILSLLVTRVIIYNPQPQTEMEGFIEHDEPIHLLIKSNPIAPTTTIILMLILFLTVIICSFVTSKSTFKAAKEEKIQLKNTLLDFNNFMKWLGAFLLVYVAVWIGNMLLIPEIAVIFFTLFVPFIIFDNPQIGIFGAIKQSIMLVIDNIKTMLLIYLIISVCGALLLSTFIGTLLLLTCIGIIVALPLMYLTIAVTFLKLKGDNNANNIIPPTSNNF